MHTPNRMWLALFGSVVFSSAGAQTIRHVFQTPPDGTFLVGNPLYVPGSPDDAIFGVTEFGGDKKNGTVWKYDLATNTESVIYSFGKVGNKNGSRPIAGLIQQGRFLYGTTFEGADGYGTLNRVDAVTSQQKVVHVFDDFPGDYSAPGPNNQLLYQHGMLYGTLLFGGDSHFGSVFGCTLGGSCQILYNFAGGTGGSNPEGQLIYTTVTLNGVSQPALVGYTDAGGAANFGMVYLLPLSTRPHSSSCTALQAEATEPIRRLSCRTERPYTAPPPGVVEQVVQTIGGRAAALCSAFRSTVQVTS